jgi:dienelactone hydrolase
LRTDLTFRSGDDRCAAWLYRPDGSDPPPVIVLAHGFGLVREARLDAYAERFAAAGFAALVFDYRHFGASSGTPRQLLDINRQLDDWRAAIATVRGLVGLDARRVALWGTSFSGGHVAALAAEDTKIAAVISQVPYAGLGGRGGRRRLGGLARLLSAAARDEWCGWTGRPPATIPIVAEPGTFGALVWPEAPATMAALLPATHTWVNAYTPRVTLRLPRYRPFDTAARIGCPWLVMVCDRDRITPPDQAAKLASRAPRLELHRLPTGHFDVYSGDWFERAISVQVDFLRRHLPER